MSCNKFFLAFISYFLFIYFSQLPSISMALSNTSLSSTIGTSVNVGENMTHTITCELPEGTLDLTIVVVFPLGVIGINASIILIGASISTEKAYVDTGNASQVVFTFGNSSNLPDNVAGPEDRILLEVCTLR
jgi:hypothetical protein